MQGINNWIKYWHSQIIWQTATFVRRNVRLSKNELPIKMYRLKYIGSLLFTHCKNVFHVYNNPCMNAQEIVKEPDAEQPNVCISGPSQRVESTKVSRSLWWQNKPNFIMYYSFETSKNYGVVSLALFSLYSKMNVIK